MPQERPKGKEMEVVLIVVVTVHFVDATPKATKKKKKRYLSVLFNQA